MLGSLNTEKKEAFIIGAGMSGLLIGYRLKQLGYKIQIHEKSNRVGGLIQTLQTPDGPVETAAHSLMVNPVLQKFFEELKIPLQPVNQNSRARYIVRNQKVSRFPLKIAEAIALFFRFLFYSSQKPLNPKTTTLKEWCEAYLGTPAHDYLLAPFVTGVFACTPEELSVDLCFPSLLPRKQQSLFSHFRELKKSSAKKPRAQMMTPTFGMQSVVDTLAAHLKEEIHLHSYVSTIPDSPNVIYTLPMPALAELIQSKDHPSALLLKAHPHAPLITATVFFKNQKLRSGVGVLIPHPENFKTLGILFNSSAFKNRTNSPEATSLTFMLGGTQNPNDLMLTDEQIKNIITREATQLLSTTKPPESIHITRWNSAIPLYSPALATLRESLKNGLCSTPGQIIFSNYSSQVSIRGMIETLFKINA